LSPADPFPGKDQYLWAITSYAAERAIMFVPKEEYGDFRSLDDVQVFLLLEHFLEERSLANIPSVQKNK
jgi:hypothetical protein